MKFSRTEWVVLAAGFIIPTIGWYVGAMMNSAGWASNDGNVLSAPFAVVLLILPTIASYPWIGAPFALLFYISYKKGKNFLIATWYLLMIAYAFGIYQVVASAPETMFTF